MLAPQRHSYILEELTIRGVARISGLASALNVSEMTIRRDLEQLAELGLLNKVHGGATARIENNSVTEPAFRTKSLRETLAKDAIAAEAAALVQPAASLALMGGSTVFALAKQIVSVPRLTVVTNSLPISDFFHREGRSDQTVILAGGLRTPTDSFVGEITVSVFDRLNIDIAFMGAHGMDPRGGFSSPNILEAETNRAVRNRAGKFVVLADHTKWGEVAFSSFATLAEADILVTDSALPQTAREILGAEVGELIVANVGESK